SSISGTASPTSVSDARFRTSPNAPSSECSTISTTVRQKFGSISPGPAISSCPRADSTSQPQRAAEDLLHDLVGSAPDRPEPRVARRPLDPVLGHIAVAAVDLQARVYHVERRPLGGELGDRHLADRILAGQVPA